MFIFFLYKSHRFGKLLNSCLTINNSTLSQVTLDFFLCYTLDNCIQQTKGHYKFAFSFVIVISQLIGYLYISFNSSG